jgi:hypothetical protein
MIRPGSTTFSVTKGIKVVDRAQWERRANVVSGFLDLLHACIGT